MQGKKDKMSAGLLALLIGTLGIHRFYLNQPVLGILYLFTGGLCGIAALIDGIVFLTMSDQQFDIKYNPYFRDERQNINVNVYQNDPSKPADLNKKKVNDILTDVDGLVSPPKSKKPNATKTNAYKSSGIRKFREYDIKGAIKDFQRSLQITYKDQAVHFNLACCYSVEEDVTKSLFHLNKAVENGFVSFQKIHEHDSLAYLRAHDEFELFVKGGYKWKNEEEKAETKGETPLTLDNNAQPNYNLLEEFDKREEAKPLLTEEDIEANSGHTNEYFNELFDGDDEGILPVNPEITDDSEDMIDKLKRLGELREKGVLTEEEFKEQKRKLLE
ncbi:MAG: NINE protein [Saprospiraceae bacterium]